MGDLARGTAQRVQQRVPGPRHWTDAKKALFIETLSRTLNISASARAVKMSTVSARALRKRDAAFDEAWDAALLVAYEELELASLKRAINGSIKPILYNGTRVGGLREFPEKLVSQLMTQHHGRVMALRHAEARAAVPGGESESDVRMRLIATFESMEVRLRGGDDAG